LEDRHGLSERGSWKLTGSFSKHLDKGMRISITPTWTQILRVFCGVFIGIAMLSTEAKMANAQLYISQLGILTVSEYNGATGQAINANLIKPLSAPNGLAVEGNNLYVANEDGMVGKYDAATGAPINSRLITGPLFFPRAIVAQGNTLFVACFAFGTIGKYDAATGKAIDANFITTGFPAALALLGNRLLVLDASPSVREYNATTGEAINTNLIARLSGHGGLAAQGNTLFVADFARGSVGTYDATTGKLIDANFITSAGLPIALALLHNTLFVANETGTIGTYDATTGKTINATFITGLQFIAGLAVKSAK
jgi:outer membrane protein assembly factor BamB